MRGQSPKIEQLGETAHVKALTEEVRNVIIFNNHTKKHIKISYRRIERLPQTSMGRWSWEV